MDKVKPFVTAVYPASGAVNAPRELKARIAFSEWVDKDAGKGKIHLSPPARKLKVEVKGDIIEVASSSLLDTGTTYVLGVAGTVRDLHGLPLEAPLQLIFSTGASLDSGILSGRMVVFPGNLPGPGIFAALYPDDPALRARFGYLAPRPGQPAKAAGGETPQPVSRADSLPHPFREKAAYVAPADSLGRFELVGVRPGRYRLLGFQDVDQDIGPDAGSELLAIGPTVQVGIGGEAIQHLALGAFDTLPTRLVEARWAHESMVSGKSQGTVRLRFSRPVHPSRGLRKELYTVHMDGPVLKGGPLLKEGPVGKGGPAPADGASQPVPVLDICLNPETGEVELHTAPLEPDSAYRVQLAAVPDIQGNPIDTSRDQAPFKAGLALDQAATPGDSPGLTTPSAPIPSIPTPSDSAAGGSRPAPVFLGPFKASGLRDRLSNANLIPSRGLFAYYPRILTDSVLTDLTKHLEVKSDTLPVTFFLSRISHHEFSLKLGPVALRGQRLQIGFRIPKAPGDTAKALPGPPRPGTPPDTARPGGKTLPGAAPFQAAPSAPVAAFMVADSARLGALQFLQDATARGARLVLRSLAAPAERSLVTPLKDDFIVDSLPEGWYSAEVFRDTDGDGLWNPGTLRPWTPQETFVHFADSIEVKPGGVSATGAYGRKLSFTPVW